MKPNDKQPTPMIPKDVKVAISKTATAMTVSGKPSGIAALFSALTSAYGPDAKVTEVMKDLAAEGGNDKE